MLCFLDESGDPGLKLDSGSSKFFTIALIIFQDNDEAGSCETAIVELRKTLKLDPSYEFHFANCSDKKRIEFLKCVSGFDFFYLSITINKEKLYGEGFNYKESFYKYAAGLVFENAKPHLDNAIVVFDGSGSREFKRQLQSYLKKRINDKDSKKIKKVKTEDSIKITWFN